MGCYAQFHMGCYAQFHMGCYAQLHMGCYAQFHMGCYAQSIWSSGKAKQAVVSPALSVKLLV